MISKELRLESYIPEGLQFNLGEARNLRFSKAFQEGEDISLSFDLDRTASRDWRDVGYGKHIILRRGLNPIWKGEMRQIDQNEEGITVNCLGSWVYLDDFVIGDQYRLWCDSRYKAWVECGNANIGGGGWVYMPQKYHIDTANHLYIAPRKNERFLAGSQYGALIYQPDWAIAPANIVRVSFDYDIDLNWTTNFRLQLIGAGMGVEWDPGSGASGSGVKDIILSAASGYLMFRVDITSVGWTTYTGNTGEDVYVEISNLRIWGQQTESPSIIHVAEDAVNQVQASTPIDASHDQILEDLLPVRDTFTDANGTLIVNHQPDVDDLRGGWTQVVGTHDIQGNQANCSAQVGAEALAVIGSGVSDGVVCADLVTEASGNENLGLVFRYQNNNNYWWCYISPHNGNMGLAYKQGGGWNYPWSSNIGIEHGFTYHMMVRLRGDTIECYLGGILRRTQVSTFNETETDHGVRNSGADAVGVDYDNFEVYQAHPIWPIFYEDGESCYDAIKDLASFGDWDYKAIGWGVESGGDRVFVRAADRNTVRYVIPPQYASALSSRGDTHREFYTEAWAKYKDEEGLWRWTAKYYVHVTSDGLEVNTTSTGDDLASVIYGVTKDTVVDFGRVDENVAIAYLIQYLQEHGHPQTKGTYQAYGPVQDLQRGGAWIDPVEMEMGHVVQIPYFRAVEAEGAVGVDLRDWDTTFLLVGLEYDGERGLTRLIPEGATEDLERIIRYAREFQNKEDREHISKRSEVIGG